MATALHSKTLGAFYTAEPAARFLVELAVRRPDDTILDPSCGTGVFLAAANERLLRLGSRSPEVWGVDVDHAALRLAQLQSPEAHLVERSFFSLRPGDIPVVSAIVGNPPFIRYQTFKGANRADALLCARESGVDLPQLCSSWAPFLVHATRFLRVGGRLAMVVPTELVHAQYAREVLRFLMRKFARITAHMFHAKIFPELSEDTFFLSCEDYGKSCEWFSVTRAASLQEAASEVNNPIPVDIDALGSGRHRITHYLIAAKARHLYENLAAEKGVMSLGQAADVGIGYVTGCNDYFHLTADEAKAWRVPRRFLRRAVVSLGDFHGMVLRHSDWDSAVAADNKKYLLSIPPGSVTTQLPKGLLRYLGYGKTQGVPGRFKCRVRNPWYSVPHVKLGDAFLSYMSGSTPKLIANGAGLVAPNTLHIVRFKPDLRWKPFIIGWQSSLTRLSCELEGHALGGGMLKLEPSEAERVLVAVPSRKNVNDTVGRLDSLLRERDTTGAVNLVDRVILRRRLGLSLSECLTLSEAAQQLKTWRMHK